MKRIVLILLPVLLALTTLAGAQNITTGARVPDLAVSQWLDDKAPAASAKLTYIEFFHSSNKACIVALDHLKELATQNRNLRVVVITQEEKSAVGALLQPCADADFAVGFDDNAQTFKAFGVQYVPFGVLVDAKNRALWMGNTLQLTPEILSDVLH